MQRCATLYAGRLRASMGAIHLGQGRHTAAIKCFRMALDQLPPSCPRPRAALLRNIGLAFVRLGRYSDAAGAWEAAMQAAPDHQVSIHASQGCQGTRGSDLRWLTRRWLDGIPTLVRVKDGRCAAG